jgi:hypothetical protein
MDTLHQILFGFLFATPKEMGNSFVVKFFHREGIIIEQGVI